MKKVKEIKGFDTLEVYKNSIIVINKRSIQLVNESLNLTSLIDANIHSFKILNDKLFYQLDDSCNLHIYDNSVAVQDSIGYALHSALYCAPYIYIYGGKDDTNIFLDIDLQFVVKAPEYCNFAFGQYLIRNNSRKKIFICYELNNKLWDYNHNDESKLEIISGYKDKVLIYSESGDFFALSLDNGNVVWKYPENCHHPNSLYKDRLYTLNKNKLMEINAETGQKEREIDIKSIEKTEKFSINRIKAYEDYILCKDLFGVIAIIDRKNLTLKEIIRFEHHLGNWTFPFIWLNNRLYVQDVEYTIHVFE